MKKRNPFLPVLLLVLLFSTACHYHRYHTRTVKVNNENTSLKIEYCGAVYFNDNGTAIEEMAPGGYIKYKKNDSRFFAKCNDEGRISYRISDGDIQLNINDAVAKEMIAAVVKEIAGHYDR